MTSSTLKCKEFQEGIKTPCLILPSYFGHLLYTPPDLHEINNKLSNDCDTNSNKLILLDVADFEYKDFGDLSVGNNPNNKLQSKSICNVPSDLIPLMSFRSNEGPTGVSDTKGLAINTIGGRKILTNEVYAKRADLQGVPYIFSLADEVSETVGNNKSRKAFERTNQWFTELKELKEKEQYSFEVIPSIVMDHKFKKSFEVLLNNLNSLNIKKIMVSGIFIGESEEKRNERLKMIREILGDDIQIIVQGIETIEQIFSAIENGVDIVHTTYHSKLKNSGKAFHPIPDTPLVDQNDEITEPETKKQKFEEDKDSKISEKSEVSDSASDKLTKSKFGKRSKNIIKFEDNYSIDLNDPKYKKDSRPLLNGCKCHACLYHTRSYIYHLIVSKELLADTLLYQHNQYQLLKLFSEIRENISNGTFLEYKNNFLNKNK